jgi:hypothetical protein
MHLRHRFRVKGEVPGRHVYDTRAVSCLHAGGQSLAVEVRLAYIIYLYNRRMTARL